MELEKIKKIKRNWTNSTFEEKQYVIKALIIELQRELESGLKCLQELREGTEAAYDCATIHFHWSGDITHTFDLHTGKEILNLIIKEREEKIKELKEIYKL